MRTVLMTLPFKEESEVVFSAIAVSAFGLARPLLIDAYGEVTIHPEYRLDDQLSAEEARSFIVGDKRDKLALPNMRGRACEIRCRSLFPSFLDTTFVLMDCSDLNPADVIRRASQAIVEKRAKAASFIVPDGLGQAKRKQCS